MRVYSLLEVIRNHSCPVTKRERSGKDESVAAIEFNGRYNPNARNSDRGEEERGHSSKDRRGYRDKCRRKLGEDTHNDEEETASKTRLAVSTACKVNNAVVLSEDAHGSYRAQPCNAAADAI